eukprot:scaffold7703_cov103-Isochrysis_galbana.AAC.15
MSGVGRAWGGARGLPSVMPVLVVRWHVPSGPEESAKRRHRPEQKGLILPGEGGRGHAGWFVAGMLGGAAGIPRGARRQGSGWPHEPQVCEVPSRRPPLRGTWRTRCRPGGLTGSPHPAGLASRPGRTAAVAASTAQTRGHKHACGELEIASARHCGQQRCTAPWGVEHAPTSAQPAWQSTATANVCDPHHILQQDGLREDGPVVDATAPVTVPAGTHLEVEWAVDLVLLGAKDLGEVLSHAASV